MPKGLSCARSQATSVHAHPYEAYRGITPAKIRQTCQSNRVEVAGSSTFRGASCGYRQTQSGVCWRYLRPLFLLTPSRADKLSWRIPTLYRTRRHRDMERFAKGMARFSIVAPLCDGLVQKNLVGIRRFLKLAGFPDTLLSYCSPRSKFGFLRANLANMVPVLSQAPLDDSLKFFLSLSSSLSLYLVFVRWCLLPDYGKYSWTSTTTTFKGQWKKGAYHASCSAFCFFQQ